MPDEKKPEAKSPIGPLHRASVDRSWEPAAAGTDSGGRKFPEPYPVPTRDGDAK